MPRPSATARDVETLTRLRTQRGAEAAQRKKALLQDIATRPIAGSRLIRAYHDCLLFLTAFPDDTEIRRLAESEFTRMAAVVRGANARDTERLTDSGIAGTENVCVYTYGITRWLARRFPGDVDLAWGDDGLGAPLDAARDLLIAYVERDSIQSPTLSAEDWLALMKGNGGQTDLEWLLDRFDALEITGELRDRFFDTLECNVSWRLEDDLASTTFQRFPQRRASYCRKRPGSVTLAGVARKRLPAPRPLTSSERPRLIDLARAALTVRGRETEATNHTNPADVTLFSLEDGFDVALLGLLPERRLPMETYYSFLVAKNRVPVAYGGGFVFLEQLDIGLHVFDAFRGGESARILAEVVRTFSRHFSTPRIFVDSAQFGWGRPDGIRSGAFWLYYKLGLRPVEESANELARGEWLKKQADPSYRCPPSTLRKLTASSLVLDLDESQRSSRDIPGLPEIAVGVARGLAERFDGDHEAAIRWAERRLRRLLDLHSMSRWPGAEREAFRRLCPLVALIPDLTTWPSRDKRSLVSLMRAKGRPCERDYALALQRHDRLRRALDALCAAGAAE